MITPIKNRILKNFSVTVETETSSEVVFVCDGAFLRIEEIDGECVATIEAEGCASVEVTESDCIQKIKDMVSIFVVENEEEFADYILEAFEL